MSEALPYAVGIAVSPVPIAAVLLLLTARRALASGLSFLAGWAVGVAVPALAFVVLVGEAGLGDSDPAWITGTEIALGCAFLVAAALVWVRRDRTGDRRVAWLEQVDEISTVRSAGLGVVLSGANPKVLALSLGAALALAESGADAAARTATIPLFTAVGTLGVVGPIAVYAAAPGRAGLALARARTWLARHEVGALALLGALIGGLFLLDAAGGS